MNLLNTSEDDAGEGAVESCTERNVGEGTEADAGEVLMLLLVWEHHAIQPPLELEEMLHDRISVLQPVSNCPRVPQHLTLALDNLIGPRHLFLLITVLLLLLLLRNLGNGVQLLSELLCM